MVCAALAAVVAGAASVSAFADTGKTIEGTFSFVRPYSTEVATDKFYYSDDFFSEPSTKQNDSLITMSMVLSLSTMAIEESTYVKKLYSDIGYKDVRVDDIDTTPTRNTIGSAIAHKKVGDKTIVAVVIKGDKYAAEWASNVTGGASGNAEGLDKAAGIVLERLKKYISDYDLKNVKLWITGYSRGGSAADLIGVYINEHMNEFPTTAEDVFVYTYEAPHCCASSKVYDNIYCIKSKNDIITYVYPSIWGLYTNGKEIYIDEDETVTAVKIDILASEPVVVLGEVPTDEFLTELMDFTFGSMNREIYSGDFDDTVADLLEMYYSKPSEEWQPTIDFVKNELLARAKSSERFLYIVMNEGLNGVAMHNSDKMYRQFTDELILAVNEITTPQELNLTQQEYETVINSLYTLLRAAGPTVLMDFKYKEGVDYSTAFPANYNDPDYDPQNPTAPILTYDQYKKQIEEYESDEPEEKTDAEQADDDAYGAGYEKGYSDGLAGLEPLKEAPLPEDAENRSEEYLKTYAEVFMFSYNNGYESGERERNTPPTSEDYSDGSCCGDEQALADAKQDALVQNYKGSYDPEPVPGETAYSEDYIKGYRESYEDAYDNYFEYFSGYYKELTLYHLGTFFYNFSDLITEHYPISTWGRIRARDPYYASGSDDPSSDNNSEQKNETRSGTDTDSDSDKASGNTSSSASSKASQTTQTTQATQAAAQATTASASGGSVATGDSTAAAYAVLALMISASAFVVCTRKKREE